MHTKENGKSGLSFLEASLKWIALNEGEWKYSTLARYRGLLDLHIIPIIGEVSVSEINNNTILDLTHRLISDEIKNHRLSKKTVSMALSVIKSILDFSEEFLGEKIQHIRFIKFRDDQKPLRVLSVKEQDYLTRMLLSDFDRKNAGILLALYTGIRIGELCALKWKNISLKDRVIIIDSSMQRVQIKEGNTQTKVIVSSPKSSSSFRRIPLPASLRSILSAIRGESEAYFLTGSPDTYVEPRSMENRFKAICQKAEIKGASFHSLRHTFATRCIELGFDVKTLSEILGHSSVGMTMNRYVHPSFEHKRKSMNLVGNMLKKYSESNA